MVVMMLPLRNGTIVTTVVQVIHFDLPVALAIFNSPLLLLFGLRHQPQLQHSYAATWEMD